LLKHKILYYYHTTSAIKEATLTIGVDAPLTGPAASYGLAVMHGVKLAAEDFNTAGGLTVGIPIIRSQ